MKRRIFTAMAVLAFSAFGMNAQTLQSTTWKAYGISFKAPAGFNVEDDSEEGYIISTPTYYITVQLLEGEGIKRSELSQELKNIASDDEVTNQTPVTTFELPQFRAGWRWSPSPYRRWRLPRRICSQKTEVADSMYP